MRVILVIGKKQGPKKGMEVGDEGYEREREDGRKKEEKTQMGNGMKCINKHIFHSLVFFHIYLNMENAQIKVQTFSE